MRRRTRSELDAAALAAVLLLTLTGVASASQSADPLRDPTSRAEPAAPGGGALQRMGPDGVPAGDCPLEHTDVQVEISGFVARVRVTQIFSNPYPDPIEALYTFPLSHRAAVDALWMRSGDREIRGEIERREQARRIYEDARDRGQLASLLDQERPNVFTQSLANLMPGARVEVEIHYVETLEFEDGRFAFRFPTVVGPRFVPGPERVPDADRITPPVTPEGTRAGHDLAIAVDIDAGVPILGLRSELHEIDVEHERGERRARVWLRQQDEIPNRDFVLRYRVAARSVRSGALVHRLPGEDGFVTFVIVPPARVTPRSASPKEMIFVIDRSGSQRGLPLEKAKETMSWILDHMSPDDTFQVIDFGSTSSQLFDEPQRATSETIRRARRYIAGLEANGGTMMAEAVRRAASVPAAGNRLRVVTFMTDGFVGNDFEVIELVRSLRGTSRWFAFGTGNSVNHFLLDEVARAGGGEVETVLLNSPGEEVARRFYKRIASPVLTDVRLEFQGIQVEQVFPREVSDVWAQRPLVIHGRYREAGRGRVIVRGFRGGEPYREVLDVQLPELEPSHDALASVWARAKVGHLMRRDLRAFQNDSFPDALKEEIVEVALEHRIVTRFTSFVAVEDRVVNEGGVSRTVPVPVEMPGGVSYLGVFGAEQHLADRIYGNLPKQSALATQSGATARMLRYAPSAPPVRARPDRAAERTEASSRVEDEISATEPRAPLSPRAAERLAPELRSLLALGAEAVPQVEVRGGRARVKVLASGPSEALLERLVSVGFVTGQTGEGWLVGWIELESLAELAELEGVEGVELP